MTATQIGNACDKLISYIDSEFSRLKQVIVGQKDATAEESFEKIQVSLNK
jgi:hypothetical protein